MAFRRIKDPEYDRRNKPRKDRTWSTRIAWGVLVGGGALIVTRASVATMVTVHGDGMAPTIADDDAVLVVRGSLAIQRGDVVVYDPWLESDAEPEPIDLPPPLGESERGETSDPSTQPGSPLRNASVADGDLPNNNVVDSDALDSNWERLRAKADEDTQRGYRLGRVLAVPGDAVTFFVPDAALGLAIDGAPIQRKSAAPIRIEVEGGNQMRTTAYEWAGSTRYAVFPAASKDATDPPWPGLDLPRGVGPIQVQAAGYLIVADNRDESACCDSRALGWIPQDALRGEVVLRLAAGAEPEKRMTWLP
jgi:signal peptidase I